MPPKFCLINVYYYPRFFVFQFCKIEREVGVIRYEKQSQSLFHPGLGHTLSGVSSFYLYKFGVFASGLQCIQCDDMCHQLHHNCNNYAVIATAYRQYDRVQTMANVLLICYFSDPSSGPVSH